MKILDKSGFMGMVGMKDDYSDWRESEKQELVKVLKFCCKEELQSGAESKWDHRVMGDLDF